MKKRILSFLLALLMVFSLLPLSALADPEVEMGVETIDEERELIVDEGICGAKLTWVLNDDGVLTIDGTGSMKDYSSKAPWDSYSTGISVVVIGDKVMSIGDGAFKKCTKLSSVFYCGSKAQWNNISIGEDNDQLLSAEMHYNYALPEITVQPKNITTAPGTTKFSITATGEGLTYQWQYQKKGSSDWINSSASSANSAKLSVNAREAINGYKYRCVVRDVICKCATSKTATLTVVPEITQQPVDLKAACGTTGKLYITAEGDGLSYQWQYQKSGGSWTNSTAKSGKTATFSINAREEINGYKYRCIVTNSCGNTVTSKVVSLTVTSGITKQPTDLKAASGTTGKFSITADGVGLTYQWQYQKTGSSSWINSSATSGKTSAFSVNVREAINGYKYRCVINDANGGSVTSSVVTLTVTANITKQPTNLKAKSGTTGKISITAKGEGLTYQWQYLKPGGSWTNSTAKSGKTATFSVSIRSAINGYKYRCKVTNSCGNTVTSSVVTLTVTPAITKQPTSLRAAGGTTGKFSVTADGIGLSYQWQFLKPGGTWTNSTAKSGKTATFSVSVRSAINGYKYRCIVKDANGNSVTSSTATLTVK